MKIISSGKISLEKLKEDLTKFFQGREEVLLVYLFGSCLQGKIGGRHDIDIAILVDLKSFDTPHKARTYGYEAELVADLMHLLKHNLVDLVILNRATPLLAYEVVRNGILVFSRFEDLQIQFEISSLKRHADTKHLRDIKRIYMKERIEKGLSAYV